MKEVNKYLKELNLYKKKSKREREKKTTQRKENLNYLFKSKIFGQFMGIYIFFL